MVLFGRCAYTVGVKRSQNNIKTGGRVEFGRASAADLVIFYFIFGLLSGLGTVFHLLLTLGMRQSISGARLIPFSA